MVDARSPAGRALLTLGAAAAFYYILWLATAPLHATHPALASLFPPPAAAAAAATAAAGALTVGVLGYCVYVFVAAAVISASDTKNTMAAPYWDAQIDEIVALASILGPGRVAVVAGGSAATPLDPDAADGDAGAAPLRVAGPPGDDDAWLEVRLLVDAVVGDGGLALAVRGAPAGRVARPPPLRLRASLPPGYPLEGGDVPAIMVSADWLGPTAAEAVEAAVAAAVATAGGAQCLFDAVEAAAAAAVPSAAPDGGVLELTDVVADDEEEEDEAATTAAAAALAASLAAADAAAESDAFRAALHACPVCLEDGIPGARCVRAGAACTHTTACAPCAAALATAALADRDAARLACPDCGGPLSAAAFGGLLPPDALALWSELETARVLAALPDTVACPHCAGPAQVDAADAAHHLARCTSCGHAFCGLCFDEYHPARACVSAAGALAALRARAAGAGAPRTAAEARALRAREDELASLAEIARLAKRCACGAALLRDGGCAKVVCRVCSRAMCWRCGDEIDGYGHYGEGRCVLFDDADVDAWRAAVAAEAAAAPPPPGGQAWLGRRAGAAPGPRRGSRCPVCATVAPLPDARNDVRCAACATRHCAACGEVLRGRGAGARHFGPRPPRCPQHSSGRGGVM